MITLRHIFSSQEIMVNLYFILRKTRDFLIKDLIGDRAFSFH
ncbi:hypothetical protein JOD45_002055 [Scopulibacillus daqui]|uniref:Uncharacterized protein n=1 Tax=Scopulibacillus daqui TaxID=1469162 RepID=A0ABS2Q0U9_9BACL|nr:hypothetical protein [Scopulibacillus daqui]